MVCCENRHVDGQIRSDHFTAWLSAVWQGRSKHFGAVKSICHLALSRTIQRVNSIECQEHFHGSHVSKSARLSSLLPVPFFCLPFFLQLTSVALGTLQIVLLPSKSTLWTTFSASFHPHLLFSFSALDILPFRCKHWLTNCCLNIQYTLFHLNCKFENCSLLWLVIKQLFHFTGSTNMCLSWQFLLLVLCMFNECRTRWQFRCLLPGDVRTLQRMSHQVRAHAQCLSVSVKYGNFLCVLQVLLIIQIVYSW